MSPNPKQNLKSLFPENQIPEDQIMEMPARFGKDNALRELLRWFSVSSYTSERRKLFSDLDNTGLLKRASNWKDYREQRYIFVKC